MEIFRGIALSATDATPITGFPAEVMFLGTANISGFPVSFIIVLIICVFFSVLLGKTRLGRQIYSVGGNQEAAKLSGINVNRTKSFTYVATGLLGGIAALILTGRVGTALPLVGDT
ncbi:MAG: ABC transporter permease [Christensenellales bacterium]|jgi:ribose transport system permease protein